MLIIVSAYMFIRFVERFSMQDSCFDDTRGERALDFYLR